MSHLAITLFGGFQVKLDGQSLNRFRTDKYRALLIYLALESKRPHRREALATLLWSNRPEIQALNNLRQALYQLRLIIPQVPQTEPHLLITPDHVRFNPASDHWIDVVEFRGRLSACHAHHPADSDLCSSCLYSLQRAIELYQGEFLAGFSLPDLTEFSEWQIFIQEVCRHQVLAGLTHLADYFESHFAYEQLIDCTQRKIQLEPWRESAYRRQMWALAMSGQRGQALRLYVTLCEVLQRELGIPPMRETSQLYEQIRDGDFSVLQTARGRGS